MSRHSQRQDKTTNAMPAGRQVKACVIAPSAPPPLPRPPAGGNCTCILDCGFWVLRFWDSWRRRFPSSLERHAEIVPTARRWLSPAAGVAARKACQHDDNLSTFRLLVCSCICSCRGCTQTCVADMCAHPVGHTQLHSGGTTVRMRLIYTFHTLFPLT